MISLAIIGCGGIGMRHLQSCMALPGKRYRIYVVDPSGPARERARASVVEDDTGPALIWLSDISALPETIDLAIVATQSDVRARVTLGLLDTAKIGTVLFEKVLFQTLNDFRVVGSALDEAGVVAYVNCARRCWPLYRALSTGLAPSAIGRLSVVARGWDVGCNGIHFLDLFSLLSGSSDFRIDGFKLTAAHPAKRAGILHLEGVLEGTFEPVQGNPIPYVINSDSGNFDGFHVQIDLRDGGRIICREEGASVAVRVKGTAPFASETWPLPFQSQVTAGVVAEIIDKGSSPLPTYGMSRRMHEPMLAVFLAALENQGLLDQPELCPIT